MLLELTVRNLAIIDDITLTLGPGLNVLTGETGAGKSIIVNALSLAVGARASSDAVRAGSPSAEVEAVFDASAVPALRDELTAQGLLESGRLIVRRVIAADGPNRVFAGGRNATAAQLAEWGPRLVSIYGQHDFRGLLDPDEQLDILDDFAGAADERGAVASAYRAAIEAERRLADLRDRASRASSRADYLDYVIQEIESARPEPGEDERLRERRRVLVSAEKLGYAARAVVDRCWEGEGSVADLCGALVRQADDARSIDQAFAPVASALDALSAAASEAAEAARVYLETLELEPGELERIDDRLDALRLLCKKHGGSIDAVLETLAGARVERDSIGNLDRDIDAAERAARAALADLSSAAAALSAKRTRAAAALAKSVASQVADLGMKKAVFEARFAQLAGIGIATPSSPVDERGAERVEFLLSANLGEPPRPLAKIASGGELSRVMLAIKNALAGTHGVPCLVFDEVDAGVGGAQAQIIGRKLKSVAATHQVLCITHLPQIAGFADRHISVRKDVRKGRTVTTVKTLEGEERALELARMLGGVELTDATLAAARELMSVDESPKAKAVRSSA